ncbi:hypothetical protein [Leucobacter japonicus]|uniref:hypothetical protein n=1 Tax=Leucobacter japonicus TaxID=1461259 RepID=UPI000A67A57E|nr:hypothetical protein [Leucobacter japonicus]
MGLATRVSNQKATIAVVVLSVEKADPAVVEIETTFEIHTGDSDLAEKLGDSCKNIVGRVRTLEPEIAVIRRADRTQKASNQEGPRFRLLIEGAVTGGIQQVIPTTKILTGKECGLFCSKSKAELDLAASALVPKKYIEAAAAALTAVAVHARENAFE